MARTKQIARKSTGGKAPRAPPASTETPPPAAATTPLTPSLALGKGKGISKPAFTGKGKGGKGLASISAPTAVSTLPDASVIPAAAAFGEQQPPAAVDTAEKTAELIASFNATSPKIDVVFAFDTTGSMYCYLQEVRKRIHESVSRLHRDIPEIRIGIIAVGDYCDQDSSYVIKTLDLTRDINALVRFITGVQPSGGGDAPEAYELALQETRSLSWEAEPGNRAFVMIGDSYPHPPSYTTSNIWWRDELSALVDLGIKVYGVQCNTTLPTRYFYEELAAVSGGGYLTLSATSCITDMFLAVCYRQVSESALEAFVADAEKSGGDVEAKRRLFGQLKSAAPVASAKKCTADWYDRTFDRGTPAYMFSNGRWRPYLARAVTPPPAPSPASAPEPSKRRRVRAK